MENVKNKDNRKNVAQKLVTVVIVACVLNYFMLVPLNIHSSEFWWMILGVLLVINLFPMDSNEGPVECIVNSLLNIFDKELRKKRAIVLLIWIALFIITSITGWKIFRSQDYSNLITVEEGNFTEDIVSADPEDLIIVDKKTAQKVGDRELGVMKNSTLYEVDNEYSLVKIGDEYVRVSPINYGGILKYFKAKEGIPAYIKVDSKTQDAELVYFEEAMMYSPSAYFGKDLYRHIYFNFPTKILGDSYFEVDDEGHPYWITGVYEAKIGVRAGKTITSAIITNALTGECVEYSLDKIPEWIEHVFSVDELMEKIRWHYKYKDGFFNGLFKTNIYKTSYDYRDSHSEGSDGQEESKFTPFEGYNTVISQNGEILIYSGLTPSNKAETIVGFVLANPKTGKVKFYEATGAEESSAQASAEGLVQNLKYSASFPTMINVDGIETYFMTLKDASGLIRKFALCNVSDYAKCVEADTLEDAVYKYRVKMGLEAGIIENEESSTEVIVPKDTKTITGKVESVTQAQISGYTYYYFTLEGNNAVYMSSIENSNYQPIKMVVGANVDVTYYSSEKEDGINIVTKISFK